MATGSIQSCPAVVFRSSAINLKPTGMGVDIVVRYIARAHQRYELRSRLYTAIVELLHRQSAIPATSAQAAGASSP